MKFLIIAKLALCSYAAIWIPFYFTAEFFGMGHMSDFLDRCGGLPQLIGFTGLILIGIDLWQSKRTNDDKIRWTVVGFLFIPIAVPAYWFMFGWPETKGCLHVQRGGSCVTATKEARKTK